MHLHSSLPLLITTPHETPHLDFMLVHNLARAENRVPVPTQAWEKACGFNALARKLGPGWYGMGNESGVGPEIGSCSKPNTKPKLGMVYYWVYLTISYKSICPIFATSKTDYKWLAFGVRQNSHKAKQSPANCVWFLIEVFDLYMSLTFGSCSTTTMTVRLQEVEDSFPCAPVGNATNIPLWSLVHLDVHLWVSKIPVVYIKIPEEKGTNNTGSLYGSCMMAGSKKSLQSCLLCVLSKTSFIIIYIYVYNVDFYVFSIHCELFVEGNHPACAPNFAKAPHSSATRSVSNEMMSLWVQVDNI